MPDSAGLWDATYFLLVTVPAQSQQTNNHELRAIPAGAPQDEIINQSNIVGIRKWTVDAEKCFKYWVNQGTECGICIRVCPYNKDPQSRWVRLYHRLWLKLAASPFKQLALWLDINLGFGGRLRPNEYWKTKLRR